MQNEKGTTMTTEKKKASKQGEALLDQLVNHAKKATRNGKKASGKVSAKPAKEEALDLDVSAENKHPAKKSKRSAVKAKAEKKAEKKPAKAEKPARSSRSEKKSARAAKAEKSGKVSKAASSKANLKASGHIGDLITGVRSKAGKYNGTDIDSIQATLASAVNAKLAQIASPKSIAQAFADVSKETFDVKTPSSHFEEAAAAVNAGLIKAAQTSARKKMSELKSMLSEKGSVAEVVVLKAAASIL